MKNILLLSLMLIASISFAQTPNSMMGLHTPSANEATDFEVDEFGRARLSSSSPNSAWYSANVGMVFKGDISESVLVGGRAMYLAAQGANWGVPILTNVFADLSDTTSADNQFELGVLPYYSLLENERLSLFLHGGFNYAIPDLKNTDQTEFNMLLGFEVALYPNSGGKPFTLSVAPEYAVSIQDTDENGWTLGVESVIPIASGMGILLKSNTPFSDSRVPDFSIGVLIAGTTK